MVDLEQLKKTADTIMSRSHGKFIGLALNPRAKFIIKKEGEDSLKKIEETMAKIGYPFKFKDVRNFHFYPIGLGDIIIITAKEIFNWKDEEIFNLAYNEMGSSLLIKIFFTTFSKSLDDTLKRAMKIWHKYLTYGDLTYTLCDHKLSAYLNADLTDRVMCQYWAGSFKRIAEIIINGSDFTIAETECKFKGGKYHTYVITWK